jgi:hypothetical protein
MATATELQWLQIADYSVTPTPTDLRQFFGIPPSPPEELDHNIREKRKYWKQKQSKARADEALAFATAVLSAIDDAEDALKKGGAAAGGNETPYGSNEVDRSPTTVDEVWRELERLLFRGRYRDALSRVESYEPRWGQYPAFIDMRNVVILETAQNDPTTEISTSLIESAITGARQVLTQLGPSEARYVTLIELLEAGHRESEIPAVFADANRAIPSPSASFRVRRLALTFRSQQWDEALRTCVALVLETPDDRALRSELVQMVIARVVKDLLPLTSEEAVASYRKVVAVAAWLANGVPEAEDFVRAHRMWAANADQGVFGGNWQWRAFFTVITAFIALPLINAAFSKPAWRVLLEGPALTNGASKKKVASNTASRNRTWYLVTRNSYIQPVHENSRLPWQQGSEWPELDAATIFNF